MAKNTRIRYLTLLHSVLLLLLVSLATASEQPRASLSSPGEVALQQTRDGKYRYVYPATKMWLYILRVKVRPTSRLFLQPRDVLFDYHSHVIA